MSWDLSETFSHFSGLIPSSSFYRSWSELFKSINGLKGTWSSEMNPSLYDSLTSQQPRVEPNWSRDPNQSPSQVLPIDLLLVQGDDVLVRETRKCVARQGFEPVYCLLWIFRSAQFTPIWHSAKFHVSIPQATRRLWPRIHPVDSNG